MRDSLLHLGAGEIRRIVALSNFDSVLKHLCRSLPISLLSEATHVIYPEGSSGDFTGKSNKTTFHVIEQWLEDSIKLKECQEEKLYKLR